MTAKKRIECLRSGKRCILLTGVAGFIGQKVGEFLLKKGYEVVGVDNLNDYYDVSLKKYRLNLLKPYKNFVFRKIDIENYTSLKKLFKTYKFKAVMNLAARAGVRYSIESFLGKIFNKSNFTFAKK